MSDLGRRPMARTLVGAVALIGLLGACTDDALPEPERAATCADLVGPGVTYVERMVDALPGLPVDVVTGELPPPPEVADLAALAAELDQRAANLGCDVTILNAAILERVAELDTDDPIAGLFLDVVREGVVAPLPPPVTTTTRGDS